MKENIQCKGRRMNEWIYQKLKELTGPTYPENAIQSLIKCWGKH